MLSGELSKLKLTNSYGVANESEEIETKEIIDIVLDPPLISHKDCGPKENRHVGRHRRTQKCGN